MTEELENKTITEEHKKENIEQEKIENLPDDEKNWRAFREQRKKEREEALKYKQEAEKAKQEKEKREKEAEALQKALESLIDKNNTDEPKEHIDDEKELEKRFEKYLEERDRERKKTEQEKAQQEMPIRLRKENPDFDKIMTDENLDYFEYKYPEIAVAYKAMPDGFDKWNSLYKAVKNFVPGASESNNKMKENLRKPRDISSNISRGRDEAPKTLDQKQREANWRRMQRVMKGISS